jgi:hypothetical protein
LAIKIVAKSVLGKASGKSKLFRFRKPWQKKTTTKGVQQAPKRLCCLIRQNLC